MAIVRHGPTQCAHEPGCPHDIGPAAAGVTSAANALAAAPELRTGMHERQGSGPVERRMETEAERESRLAAYERQALATRIAEDRTKAARERAQQAQEGEAMTRPARQRKATDEEILAALRRHRGNRNAAAGELGMTVTPMTKHCERIAAAGAMPDDVAELLASRSQYGRRRPGSRTSSRRSPRASGWSARPRGTGSSFRTGSRSTPPRRRARTRASPSPSPPSRPGPPPGRSPVRSRSSVCWTPSRRAPSPSSRPTGSSASWRPASP